VIAAPHGTFDAATDEIGVRVATLTGAGAVVATGFCASRTGGVRVNVNRPTEGASLAPSSETVTERARAIHEAYVTLVRRTAAGGLVVYCEVHGNRRAATAGRIEVATAGIDRILSRRLKRAAARATAALMDACGTPLELCVEPTDRLHLTAAAARGFSPFAESRRVLHVELPRAARSPLALREAAALVAVLLATAEAAR